VLVSRRVSGEPLEEFAGQLENQTITHTTQTRMLARLSVARRVPHAFSAVRAYTTGRTEGSVAESKGFR